MKNSIDRIVIAFEDTRLIATGALRDVAVAVKEVVDRNSKTSVQVFDAETSHPVELDLRGTSDDVVGRIDVLSSTQEAGGATTVGNSVQRRGPGRPKLGVVGREVTLLPRHWEWLSQQPGSASVTLRKLVEQARKHAAPEDRRRHSRESTYRFMSAIAGNQPGYEEAIRALFSNLPEAREAFDQRIGAWPEAIRDHAKSLAQDAFAAGDKSSARL